jgi:hypothetical protein
MNISIPAETCERSAMERTGNAARRSGPPGGSSHSGLSGNTPRRGWPRLAALAWALGWAATAQTTNLATTNGPAAGAAPRANPPISSEASAGADFDHSPFRIVAERNIFNANRSGGQVRLPSRRPAQVESFTLVGTLEYAKGAFAFFNGSSSAYSKVLQAGGVIAGHKLVAVLPNAVKLEADGKVLELPVGASLRREDEGTWHPGAAFAADPGATQVANRGNGDAGHSYRNDAGGRFGRVNGREATADPALAGANSGADPADLRQAEKREEKEFKKELKLDSKAEAEILKRLMERRAKESQ